MKVLCISAAVFTIASGQDTIVFPEFSIEYSCGYKLLRNIQADKVYFLNESFPSTSLPPSLVSQVTEVVQIPVESFGITSSTFAPFAELLGVADKFTFYPSLGENLGGCIDPNSITTIPDPVEGETQPDAAEVWAAMADPADVLFADSFSADFFERPAETSTERFSIVEVSANIMDPWLVYMAAFFDVEQEALRYLQGSRSQMSQIETNFNLEGEEDERPVLEVNSPDAVQVLLINYYSAVQADEDNGNRGTLGLPENCESDYDCDAILDADDNAVVLQTSVYASIGESLTSLSSYDNLMSATLGKVRVDKIIIKYYMTSTLENSPYLGLDQVTIDGTSTAADMIGRIRADRASFDANPDDLEVFFLPDTSTWFALATATPHLVYRDFATMVNPERASELYGETPQLFYFEDYNTYVAGAELNFYFNGAVEEGNICLEAYSLDATANEIGFFVSDDPVFDVPVLSQLCESAAADYGKNYFTIVAAFSILASFLAF